MRTAAWFLLLGLLPAALCACSGNAPRTARLVVAPELVSPRGPTVLPFTFAWKAVPDDARPDGQPPIYRLRVTDAAERVMLEQDLRATECRPTSELVSMMADHGAFAWTVALMSADGSREVARSAPMPFSLK